MIIREEAISLDGIEKTRWTRNSHTIYKTGIEQKMNLKDLYSNIRMVMRAGLNSNLSS